MLLKKDLFGEIHRVNRNGVPVVVRDCSTAAAGLRWLARHMMRREARALATLEGMDGISEVLSLTHDQLERSYFPGAALQRSKPSNPAYFKAAARMLRRMHSSGVAHNDLGKEPNLIVREDGSPAFIDFQLSWCAPRRGRLFRLAAREDLRHLLKHKRSYCPAMLTLREQSILASPSWASIAWANTGKPVYVFVTRRLLGWSDREGAGNRGDRS